MTITDEIRHAARQVPFAMQDPLHVPKQRYYDREFFELEKQHLWPKVWQVACRAEDVPRPGDYVEYEIVGISVLVVRQKDGTIKAFENACRHRATQLCTGAGSLRSGQIVCPFHGWRWAIDGTNTFVYGRDGFDDSVLADADLRLREVQVDTYAALVWVNLDPQAAPLRETLSPASDVLDLIGAEHLRVYWWKETILDANWKLAQEAFHEGYHVMQAHPQLTLGMGEDYPTNTTKYTGFPHGHGVFHARATGTVGGPRRVGTADEFIERSRTLWEGQDAMTLPRDIQVFEGIRHKVAEGEDFRAAAMQALHDYAEGAGIPIPRSPEAMQMWGGDLFLFPNFFVLPQYGNALSYRIRPYGDDPEKCRFEVWSLTMYPEGTERPRPASLGCFPPDDVENWGLIPRQDFGNIPRQQKGLHTPQYEAHRLANEWERVIANMHEELDRYLAR